MTEEGRITVTVDADLEDLVPVYLQTKQKDIEKMTEALGTADYETIRLLGHSMKGSGGGYGFDRISQIGREIEEAAKGKNDEAIKKQLAELASFLDRVEVVYRPED